MGPLAVATAPRDPPQHLGNGRFSAEPRAAKRAFGRIYAAWALQETGAKEVDLIWVYFATKAPLKSSSCAAPQSYVH